MDSSLSMSISCPFLSGGARCLNCWGNASCVDVEGSLLFRHIAVAVSL